MADAQSQYFDYLAEHGESLQNRLGDCVDIALIDFWRRHGKSDPGSVTGYCRKVAEHALNALSNNDQEITGLKLREKIEECEDRNLINHNMALKLHSIRTTGNNGVHKSVNDRDARMSLELLDDLFRFLIKTWEIDLSIPAEAKRDPGSIFYLYSKDDAAELNRKAKTAALLSGDTDIEKEARKATDAAIDCARVQQEKLNKLSSMIEDAIELGRENATPAILESQEQLFDNLDHVLQTIEANNEAAQEQVIQVAKKIDRILSEEDYIRKLLEADGREGKATEAQFEVMAFPRTQNTTTNMLMLNGGAGTGKTLCLLAKLISDLRPNGQLELTGIANRRGLFLCFNKSLAGYVRGLLKNYVDENLQIEVVSYDQFVNQLVRNKPSKQFEYLGSYASNVRYPAFPYWNVAYGDDVDKFVSEAMGLTATYHPDHAKTYYLNNTVHDNVAWVGEEIRWLDARYDSPSHAASDYPTTPRTGRGTKHLPSTKIRQIILEIWDAYETILRQNKRYTVEQTTKRLMAANSLPKYDSIAVDEVQDFTLASVKLITRFRRSDKSCIYLSGDENQKIYQRDFTWKELGEDARGHTITLKQNMRNSKAIRQFAERLNGKESSYETAHEWIHVENRSDEELLALAKNLLDKTGNTEKTVIIGNKWKWDKILRNKKIPANDASKGAVSESGLYVIGELVGKGLEFDNVIVDYDRVIGEDEASERRLRYVHFTRARRRLYVRYQGQPPNLLKEYYGDFLAG